MFSLSQKRRFSARMTDASAVRTPYKSSFRCSVCFVLYEGLLSSFLMDFVNYVNK